MEELRPENNNAHDIILNKGKIATNQQKALLLEIQFKQVLAKQKELMFIAENIDLFIEELWKKREETVKEYLDDNKKIGVYDLWRGNSMDFDFRDTGNSNTIYSKVQQKFVGIREGIKKENKILTKEELY